MKFINRKKGLTLIEIIVAIAIFGIVAVIFMNMFSNGYVSIFNSGHRSNTTMDLKTIIDDLNEHAFADNASIVNNIANYLDGKGFKRITDLSKITIKVSGYDVNYYIAPRETKANTPGYQVIILKFYNNGKSYVKATTFVIAGGA